jgi:peptide/nickel transport system permease protein
VVILGGQGTPHQIAAIHAQLGLDRPLPLRYLTWIGHAFKGDFGSSFLTHESIGSLLAQRIPVSLELMALAQLLALVVSVPLALLSVQESFDKVGRIVNASALGVLSIPSFVLALVAIYLVAVRAHLLPAIGFVPFSTSPWLNVRDMLLPACVLAAHPGVIYYRVLRSELFESLRQDYSLMARSQGLPWRVVLLRHVFPPALPTLVTIVGIHTGTMIGGAVVVETIFGLPGVGSLIVSASATNDYLVLQSCVLAIAVGFVFINFLVDLAQLALDPRVRYART